LGRLADEAFRMSAAGGIENGAPPLNGFRCQTIMNHSRREKAQSGMAVFIVIPGEELLGALRKLRIGPKDLLKAGTG
jgi:hypothetical protein